VSLHLVVFDLVSSFAVRISGTRWTRLWLHLFETGLGRVSSLWSACRPFVFSAQGFGADETAKKWARFFFASADAHKPRSGGFQIAVSALCEARSK
jgi:hypothetical protein